MNQGERLGRPVRVVGICGSLREASYTRMAVRIALRGAADLGAETRLLDLRDYRLSFFVADQDVSSLPDGVLRLRADVRQAQGVILGTPEYHGSLSGVLKNALDFMGFEELEGKMAGLVGVSAGSLGAVNALDDLRTIGRALHAWVVPEQVSIPAASKAFDAQGNPQSLDLERRLLNLGRQVARFAYLHSAEQAQEFLRLWEKAPPNPGGGGMG